MIYIFRLAVAFLIVACVLYLVEWLTPAIKQKPLWRKDSHLDLIYWFFTAIVSKALTRFTLIGIVVGMGVLLGRKLNPAAAATGFPPLSSQPTWALILEILLIGDFIGYWVHRAFHKGRLWKFHAIHHSSKELDWLSSVRLHPINDVIAKAMQVVPFVLLGFPLQIMAAYVLFLTFFAILVHANINWSFGPLRFVIVTPQFHRWHHTSEEEGLDKNFAGLFPFWDIIFGTFYMPKNRAPTQFGVKGEIVPSSLVGQLVYPFH